MLEVEMSEKGDGVPVEGKCRWLMRNSDGTVWETGGYYLPEEVDQWECSKPVEPVKERENDQS